MKVLFPFLFLFIGIVATAQPRFTDSTFGTSGKVIKNTSIPYKNVVDIVLQTDGKSVVLAEAKYNHVSRIVLLRYNINGTPDNTFSGDGIADSLLRPGIDCYPKAIKLQSDGKILVCGTAGSSPKEAFVIRYLIDGNPDPSFGTSGIFYEPPVMFGSTTASLPGIDNLVILTNNKLILLSSYYGGDEDLFLTRLNTNGTIDSTWGSNGVAAVDASNSYNPQYTRIEVQSDGKFLVGGNEYNSLPGVPLKVAMIRLKATGSLDSTYGINGRVAMRVGPASSDYLKDIALQPDGKVLISGVGEDYYSHYYYAFVIRFQSNGTLDSGFGNAGISYILPPVAGTFYSVNGQLTLQVDGKIILAGCSRNVGGRYDMAVARLLTSGQMDTSFDTDGFATLSVSGYANYAIAAQQQPDGKVIMTGLARSSNATSVTIARLTGTGVADGTLNAVDAITNIGSGTSDETGLGVEIQPDGKAVNVNGRYNGGSYDLAISRYTTTGAADTTWGSGGTTLVETSADDMIFFSGQLSNGKLMMATGYNDYFWGSGILLLRLNASGTVDSSFSTNGKLFIKTSVTSFVQAFPQVAFQQDGKSVLLYTQKLTYNSPDSNFVIRLNANGTYDNTFNGTGRKFLPDSNYSVFSFLALQPDKKILVWERRFGNGPLPFTALRRIAENGSTDNTFNGGNTVSLPLDVTAVGLQADGKILSGGTNSKIVRLNSNGTRDASFGSAGITDLAPSFLNFYNPVTIKESGSNRLVILGSGYDTTFSTGFAELIALKQNGKADSSFGNAGVIEESDLAIPTQTNKNFAVQADEKIVLTNYTESANTYYTNAVLTRLNPIAASTGRRYTFTGSGLWSNPTNWADGSVPPTTVPAGSSIVIDPPAIGECVIDITVHVQTGASVTIKAGKRVRLPGNLIIQ